MNRVTIGALGQAMLVAGRASEMGASRRCPGDHGANSYAGPSLRGARLAANCPSCAELLPRPVLDVIALRKAISQDLM